MKATSAHPELFITSTFSPFNFEVLSYDSVGLACNNMKPS
jgi:hypothetical protein